MRRHLRIPAQVLVAASGFLIAVLVGAATARLGEQAVYLAIFALAAILIGSVWSRPKAALLFVVLAGCFNHNFVYDGRTFGTAEMALLAFAPGIFGAWRAREVPRSLRLGFALLVVGSCLAAIGATSAGIAWWGAVRWALMANFVFGAIAISRRDSRALWHGAIALSLVSSVVGLVGWLQVRGIYLFVGPPYNVQPDAGFGYYSNYANFVAIGTVISFGAMLHLLAERRYGLASLVAAAGAISAYGVLAAASRGALGLVAVGLAVLFIATAGSLRRIAGTGIALTLSLAVAWQVAPIGLVEKMRARFLTSMSGDTDRAMVQHVGRHLAEERPGGLGYWNFINYVESGAAYSLRSALPHAHNTYIQTALDAGWLGLAGVVIVFGVAFCGGIRASVVSRGAAPQATYLAALVGLAVQLWNDFFWFETGSMLGSMVLIAGAAAPFARPTERTQGDGVKPSRPDRNLKRSAASWRRAEMRHRRTS